MKKTYTATVTNAADHLNGFHEHLEFSIKDESGNEVSVATVVYEDGDADCTFFGSTSDSVTSGFVSELIEEFDVEDIKELKFTVEE